MYTIKCFEFQLCILVFISVCHRRSLSDDILFLGRSSSGEDPLSSGAANNGSHFPNPSAHQSHSSANPHQVGRTPQEVVEKMGAADPYFTPFTATVNPFTQVKLPAPSRLIVQDGARFCHSLPEPLVRKSPTSSHQNNNSKPHARQTSHHHGSHSSLFGKNGDHGPRQDAGGGGSSLGPANVNGGPVHLVGGTVKRRGSGESGFFSVGDMDRTGTPELWLSYSELSCASFALEDEERSWVTDSSEDLCGQEEPDTQETDIKAIVEFFERGYGSLKQGPLLGPRGSSRLSSPRSPASPPHPLGLNPSFAPRLGGGKSCQRPLRRDTFRVKDRPKLYITEGTVRARRDIFEAK